MTSFHNKVIVVGDPNTGKNCLLNAFKYKGFDPIRKFKRGDLDVNLNGKIITLSMWNTSEMESDAFMKERQEMYAEAKVILICYSIGCHASKKSVEAKWFPEIKRFSPKAKIILVGNKKDMRTDNISQRHFAEVNEKPVSTEEGEELAKKVDAFAYLECSPAYGHGHMKVLQAAAICCPVHKKMYDVRAKAVEHLRPLQCVAM